MQVDTVPEFEIRIRRRRTSLRIRIWGWVLTAMCFLGGTSFSWAGCGDYVTIEKPELSPSHGAMDVAYRPLDLSTAKHSVPPCRGPGCQQRRPSIPALPSPVTDVERFEYAALCDGLATESKLGRGWLVLQTDASPHCCPSTRIERPPRHV